MTDSSNPLVDKLNALADALDKDIKHKLATRKENTPKRQREAAEARWSGRQLQATQRALRALAIAHATGTCPDVLKNIKTKSAILPMMRTEYKSERYYEFVDTYEYSDKSPEAVALRALMDIQLSQSDAAAIKRQEQLFKLRDLEATVRNSDIDGFFPTPPSVSRIMFECSDFDGDGLVLEPSAGAGHLADAIQERYPRCSIVCCERHYSLVDIIKAKGYPVWRGDFLMENPAPLFDAVLMNPPFDRLADCDHIRHAFQFLKPGGELLSIASKSFASRNEKKAQAFRDWLATVGAWAELPEGAFSGSDAFRQTSTRVCLVKAIKR